MAERITDFAVNSARWLSLEDFEGEVWKDIPDYEGLYVISNYGRVKSLLRTSTNYSQIIHTRIMACCNNCRGYLKVNLSKESKTKQQYVHRLVAQTFIPNPLKMPHINHRDENKQNNSVSNLEWCTPNYNNKYGTARARLETARRENGNVCSVDMYDINGTFLKHYDCANDMQKDGISRREAYNVCNGRIRSYKGCVFRFSGEPFSYRNVDVYPKGLKKEVVKRDLKGNIIKTYPSIKAAERENGLSRNYLYSATYASTRMALVNGAYFQIRRY